VVTDFGTVLAVEPLAQVKQIDVIGSPFSDYIYAQGVTIPCSMNGGAGDDTLTGGNANDTLVGGDGNDWLVGNAGNDSLEGDNGNDSLFGGAGNDYLNGGTDAFFYYGSDGDDLLDGGPGNNWAIYSHRLDNLTIRLDGTNRSGGVGEHDTLVNIQNVIGGAGNDVIIGNNVVNYLDGGTGNDTVYGQAGNDLLVGNVGNNTVYDGPGDNFLFLQAGSNGYSVHAGDHVDRNPSDYVVALQSPPP
jgi:Ca2+-binding RTX toxin-like protein